MSFTRRTSLALSLLVALPAAASADLSLRDADWPAGQVPRSVVTHDGQLPALQVGELDSSRLDDASSELRARQALDALRTAASWSALPLRDARRLSTPLGEVLRFEQAIDGVPIIDGAATVRLDSQGRVRHAAATAPIEQVPALTPTLDAGAAMDHAMASMLEAGVPVVSQPSARLVLLPRGRTAQLAWEVHTPLFPLFASDPMVYVDAHSGDVIKVIDRVRFANKANVYPTNPVASPDISEVTLERVTSAEGSLANAQIEATNCVDLHETIPISIPGLGPLNVHMCTEMAAAIADDDGDWLYTESDASPDDADADLFAESHMYYHLDRIYEFFRGFGFTTTDGTASNGAPLRGVVNFRLPFDITNATDMMTLIAQATNPNGPLYPFDNAFFLPGGEMQGIIAREMDSIVMGQGHDADFAYDGDVIYHEFGHAVVDSTAGLAAARLDEQGLDSGPGAMNEGYSDYFSAALAGDPDVGEYASQGFIQSENPVGTEERTAIRSIDAGKTCPEDLRGEVHYDSEPFSGALWSIRAELGAQVDQPVYTAMAALLPVSGFAEAAAATVGAIEDALGSDAAASAQAIFDERGISDCERILDTDQVPELFFIEGKGSVGLEPYAPGYLQFKVDMQSGDRTIHGRLALAGTMGADPTSIGSGPELGVLIRADEPITFSYVGSSVNSDQTMDATVTSAGIDPLTGQPAYEFEFELSINLVDPRTFYVMPINKGDGQGVVVGLSFWLTDEGAGGDADADADADSDADADADADGDGDGGDVEGCCSQLPRGATGPGAGTLLLLGLALVGLARRRRS